MKYYLITAMSNGREEKKLFLSYFDDGEDIHYWNTIKQHSDVVRLATIEDARALIANRREFTLIENDGTAITLPSLLQSIKPTTLAIETEWVEEHVEYVDTVPIIDDYIARKRTFDDLYQQLKEV